MAEGGGERRSTSTSGTRGGPLSIKELKRQLAEGKIDYETYSRRRDEADLAAMDDDDPLKETLEKEMKRGNIKRTRSQSSEICEKELDDLYRPIKIKEDNGSYEGPDGSIVYQQDIENMKEDYLALTDLGPMKSAVLDRFLGRLSEKSIATVDENATKAELERQDNILQLLVKLEKLFEAYRKSHKNLIDECSDTIIWFDVAAVSLDEWKYSGNKAAIGTAATGIISTTAGITVVSLVLAPVTFGASLALGLGVSAAAVGLAAGGTGLGYRIAERRFNTKNMTEQKTRIDRLVEIVKEVEQAIQNIRDHGMIIEEALRKEYGLEIPPEEAPHSEDRPSAPTETPAIGEDQSSAERGAAEETPVTPHSDDQALAPTWISPIGEGSQSNVEVPSMIAKGSTHVAAVADDVINIVKTGMTVADDIVDVAKAGLTASRAIGGLAIFLGGISLIFDGYTLVKAVKDMKAGSKSETAIRFRDKAREVERVVRYFESGSRSVERQVNQAEDLMRPLLKRRTLLLNYNV